MRFADLATVEADEMAELVKNAHVLVAEKLTRRQRADLGIT